MKKFFLMIILVSTFFLGLGAVVERTGAKFKSDPQALELIRLARIAIGGDANINSVRSMTISGNSTHVFEKNGVRQTENGSVEINMQLPNMYSKIVRIGTPGGGDAIVEKDFDVVILRNDEGNKSGDKDVFIVKKGDGDVNWTSSDGGKKITVRKSDDSTADVKTVVTENVSPTKKEWVTKDGKRIVVENDVKLENISGNRNNEMFRMTMALLGTASENADAAYKFAGEASVDGNACSVILVQTGETSFKLFLDKSTYLPRMISYEDVGFPRFTKAEKDGSGVNDKKIVEFKAGNSERVEHRLNFSDFRSVNGLLLPFRWSETVGGMQTQTIDITGYEINPANIAEKFNGEMVFVRKVKEQ